MISMDMYGLSVGSRRALLRASGYSPQAPTRLLSIAERRALQATNGPSRRLVVGIVAGRHRQRVAHLARTVGMLSGGFKLLPPALDGVFGAGKGAQDRRHVGQIAHLEAHIAGMTGRSRPDVGVAQRVGYRTVPT